MWALNLVPGTAQVMGVVLAAKLALEWDTMWAQGSAQATVQATAME
jgi:hypothetical protein